MVGNRFTRRVVLATAAVAVIVGGMPGSAHAGPDTPASSAARCDTEQLTMLFWPEGHPAIPEVGFPEFLRPHIEVQMDTDLSSDAAAGYADADGQGGVASSCAQAEVVNPKKPKKAKTEKEAAAIVCEFDRKATVQVEPGGGTAVPRVSLLQSAKVVGATATIGETGAKVVYNKTLCKARPAPPKGP